MGRPIYIIGKVPPPIGGVTVHVRRLISSLKKESIDFVFFDLARQSKVDYLLFLLKGRNFHLHTSSAFLRLVTSVFCWLFRKKLIITFHGDIGRYGFVKNQFDRISIWCCSYPLLLNKHSLFIASKINNRSKLISSYIAPLDIDNLPEEILSVIRSFKCEGHVFCTNAHNVAFDKNDNEIYQISTLVEIFNRLKDSFLVVSDPSGNYKRYIEERRLIINSNIFFITFEHDFNAVLLEVDCFIRYTTTDGDSISVKEALSLGKDVIASAVVDRPEGVQLFNTADDLATKIKFYANATIRPKFSDNGIDDLFNLYNKL